MATAELVREITKLAGEITGRDVNDIVRNSKWGEYNFEDCRDDLERAYSVIRPLPQLPLESLLKTNADGMVVQLTGLRDAINAVVAFSIKQGNPEQQRNNLASTLGKQARNVWTQIAPWIGYLFFQAGDVTESLRKIAKSHEQVESALTDFLSKSESGKDQIKSAVTAAKDMAGKAGVGHFTDDFANEAEKFGEIAKGWLAVTGVFTAATAIAACLLWYLFDPSRFSDVPSLIQLTTMKVIVLGLLFTAAVWSGGMYKTAKHQETVNKHRANALKTFQAFVEAAGENSTRDAVLMETTRSIFAITPSGYLGNIDKGSDSGAKIVEVFKAASKAAK